MMLTKRTGLSENCSRIFLMFAFFEETQRATEDQEDDGAALASRLKVSSRGLRRRSWERVVDKEFVDFGDGALSFPHSVKSVFFPAVGNSFRMR
jgi:hypothetical protein